MPFQVKMIVYRRMGGGELLQTSHSPEARHRPLSSPERLVRTFSAIVERAARLPTTHIADLFHRSAI